MKRFNPLKASGVATPKLAIVPFTNDAGAVVDAVVIAVVPDEPETGPRPKGRVRHSSGRGSARAARPDHLKVSVVTLTENEAKNGLQLHFPSKPDEAVRTELKASGWRWSFYNACWYHRNTPENRQWAEQFIARRQVAAPATDKIVPMVAPPSQGSVPSRGSTARRQSPDPKQRHSTARWPCASSPVVAATIGSSSMKCVTADEECYTSNIPQGTFLGYRPFYA
jgi:hypothetical protein